MATKCADCPLGRFDFFARTSREDMRITQKFKMGELSVDPGTPILMEGSNAPQLYTALRGMGIRYKTLENGRRQVINFVMPGDFIGLQAGVMQEMKHSVEATTHMTLCVFDRSELWGLFKNHPERGFDLTWLAAVEEHLLGESLATVGQRSAIEAVAWALLRVYRRGEATGLVTAGTMPFPYRQQDLADALGLSLVHTNKTLKKLSERQLVTWVDGNLRVADIEELAIVAQAELEPLPKRPFL